MDIQGKEVQDASDRLIVALDVATANEALAIVEELSGEVRWFKVGMELFYAAGPELVRELRQKELPVFLDLKLHDIPNTVAHAVRSVCQMDVQLLTLHAGGGPSMLEAAARAALGEPRRPQLLGVTVLTSLGEDELAAVGVQGTTADQVHRLAELAVGAGLDGMVCSPREVAALREEFGPQPLLVVPGVRPMGAATDDQTRTSTPGDAVRAGASLLVVGRPITRAMDPRAATRAILDEMREGGAKRPA